MWFGKSQITLADSRLSEYLYQFGKSYNKYVPDIIKTLSPKLIDIFLTAYCLGDGSIRKGIEWKGYKFNDSRSFHTSSERMMNDLTELIIKCGKSVSVKYKNTKGLPCFDGRYIMNNNIFTINENSSKYSVFSRMNLDIVDDYNDYFYDIEVDINNTLLVNYNGYIHWGSNCNCSFNEGNWNFEPSQDGKYPCDICIEMSKKYKNWYSKKGTGESSRPGSRNFNDAQDFAFEVVADKQILVGPAMIPNVKIYREDDDGNGYYVKFSEDTIRKLVDKFVKNDNNRSINLEHSDTMVPAYIQEHWIVENSTYDKSKYYGFDLPVGTWCVIVKIEDTNFWNTDIKEQKRYGFSIEGVLGTKLVQMSEDLSYKQYIEEIIDSMTEEDFMEIAAGFSKIHSDYPDGVKNNAKKVLEWTEKNGWGSCGTPVGKRRANQLANGEPISVDTIKRMYSYLSRHEGDLDSSKSFGDGCGYLMYMAWGGKAALGWSHNKLKQLGEIDE